MYLCTSTISKECWMKFGSWTYGGFMVRLLLLCYQSLSCFLHICSKLTYWVICNTNLIPQLDLRHMNQLPTNNSIGIAMDLRSHLNVFIFNFLSISNQTFFFNLQLVSSLSKIFCVFCRLLIFSRDFYISTEWDVMEVPAQRNEKYYPCCEVKVQKNIHAVR